MGYKTELHTGDQHTLGAYCAEPQGKPRGAIIVLSEFFGVNAHIRKMADEFSDDGFFAIAPAVFDRIERDVELDYDEAGMAKGRMLRSKLDLEGNMFDVQAAIDAARKAGGVAVLGYCWGGSLAFIAAARLTGLDCAVGYYGAQIAAHADEKPKVPTLLHFAEHDEYIPASDIERVRKARPDVEMFDYPGTEHGFNCDERRFFDPDAAKLARARSLDFIAKHLPLRNPE